MIALQNMTVGERLKQTAMRFSAFPAVEYGGKVWDYQTLDTLSDHLAGALLAHGVRRGEHLAIWADAEPNTLLLFYAVQKIGAVAAMINTKLGGREVAGLLASADIKYLALGSVYNGVDFSALCEQLPKLQFLQKTFYIGEGEQSAYIGMQELLCLGESFPRETLDAALAAVTPNDPALILFTSGTTALPKAVVTSHYSRVNSGIAQARDLSADEHDRFCVAMPMFHCFCVSSNVMAALSVGACLYLPKSRHTAEMRYAFREGHCTILNSVPTMFHALLTRPEFDPCDFESLRIGLIGGAPNSPSDFRAIEDALSFTLLSSLGQTEATGGITVTSPSDSLEVRSTTVGHFMDNVEGKIVDVDTRESLSTGKTGEICVRGYVVMLGYYNKPELTAETIDSEGWLNTGDLGYLDEQGNLHLTGRIRDIIIRGGENISPREIELLLMTDSRIAECKVVGVPDKHYGQELCACVVPSCGQALNFQELRETLASRLADYKIPRYFLSFGELPHTESGKIASDKLAELAAVRALTVVST